MKNIYRILSYILLMTIVELPLSSECSIFIAASDKWRYDINEAQYEGVYQYDSDWVNEKECRQDGVAVQRRIRKMDSENNAYIPMFNDEYRGIINFLSAHYVKNYGWMLDKLNGLNTEIKSRD